jgi:putative phosphoribosyl transferase
VLQGELDVVSVHKLGSAGLTLLAIGPLNKAGNVFLSGYGLDIDDSYLEVEKQAQLEVLRKRRARYTPARVAIDTMTVSSSWSTMASRGTVL